jgi:hypothetical protein
MQTQKVLFDDRQAALRAAARAQARADADSGVSTGNDVNNLGTLNLGKSARASGRLTNGETDVYRFTVRGSNRNTLTLNNRFNGSLQAVSITDRQGNVTSGSSGISGNGETFNAFSNVPEGTYFLNLKGEPGTDTSYAVRLRYQSTRADSDPATDFSDVLNQPGIDFSDASTSID